MSGIHRCPFCNGCIDPNNNGDCPFCGCRVTGCSGYLPCPTVCPPGPRGEKGDKGDPGETGPRGERGERGFRGFAGRTGVTGPAGSSGERGPTGAQGPTGSAGITGPQGAAGATGPTGPQGDRGDDATNFTTVNMSAIHTGGITLNVPVSGIAIPLNRTVLNGFAANAAYDTFTVQIDGLYVIGYDVKTRDNTTVKVRMTRNGAPLSGTVRSTSVPTTNFSLSLFVRLNAGDELQLQFYDLNGVDITLQGGTGAGLWIIRLM